MKALFYSLLFGMSLILNGIVNAQQENPRFKTKTLIVFFDGLRPDYITEAQMPNLFAFKKTAAWGKHHHSVFPTVTRVNSASYATGSYPGTHGLLGNAIYIPEVAANKSIGTTYGDLNKIPAATSGPLLTAKSLGEVLADAGQKMMVFSSGTTGQAFLQNHTVNGAIVNPDLILPEAFKKQVLDEIGLVSQGTDEEHGRHKWITDALLKYGLTKNGPLVSAIWFSDPDGAAHEHGIGSEQAVEAIKYVDGQFGRIIEALQAKGADERYNVIISTDHGFVTHTGKQGLTDFLIKEGFKKDKESDDVVVAEGAIYVKNHDEKVIANIVSALHKQEWVGAVFTKGAKKGDVQGQVKGTLSFDLIHYDHPKRSGDILLAPNWNDAKNDKGYAGTDYSGGVAGHGGSSPYEINIALLANGPDFQQGVTTELPTSNVDIVPTILNIYNLPKPVAMDGRAVAELLKKSPKQNSTSKKQLIKTEAKYSWGSYQLSAEMSVLGAYRYFNYAKTERTPAR
ncbi:Predicted pyrophosphatase or phosphodiesterase, AlkP superfamily [Dyadobacter soli]|uniref:Predicted pyrophosphatase or phosphodiesterase, AlkP superfamily n=1 Tax=Dyadobacter soli TaxID=659014 RepID=A0A1G7NTS8_9BACT|nr:alkaline phosphatase family protein [Dyadobacter soli]SDF77371.1 Predicted pyrophosphatase or phosphodiesterase, AlkP superfamily [Dyadobacter soli]